MSTLFFGQTAGRHQARLGPAVLFKSHEFFCRFANLGSFIFFMILTFSVINYVTYFQCLYYVMIDILHLAR